MSAAVQVCLQQLFEQDRHVGIGSVHFIDHQQAARQGGVAQVGMGNLQGAEQCLVDGADGDRRGEKTLGVLAGPALRGRLIVRVVGPQHLEIGQRPGFLAIGGDVARQGAQGQRRILRPQAIKGVLHAFVELAGGNACRQGEVEAIHFSGAKKPQIAPERGLGLAAAGF
jgi:hypothetical protein